MLHPGSRLDHLELVCGEHRGASGSGPAWPARPAVPPRPAVPAPPLLSKDAEKSLRWRLGGSCCVCVRNTASAGFRVAAAACTSFSWARNWIRIWE